MPRNIKVYGLVGGLVVIMALTVWNYRVPERQSVDNRPVVVSRPSKFARTPWGRRPQTIREVSAMLAAGGLAMQGSSTDIETAGRVLGFNLRLPQDHRAIAAGAPKIFGPRDVDDYVRKNGAAPRPQTPREGGTGVEIEYPNGFAIFVQIRHPRDAALEYKALAQNINDARRMWVEKGIMSDTDARLTDVRGHRGYEIEAGWTSRGDSETTVTEDLKRPVPARIVWYDSTNWAQYVAEAPVDATLGELREVAESIY